MLSILDKQVKADFQAFIEIENKFSKRMLPGKKRTTRIY